MRVLVPASFAAALFSVMSQEALAQKDEKPKKQSQAILVLTDPIDNTISKKDLLNFGQHKRALQSLLVMNRF
jgi:Tfp pilus assembly pilus retraction ATPase PilT